MFGLMTKKRHANVIGYMSDEMHAAELALRSTQSEHLELQKKHDKLLGDNHQLQITFAKLTNEHASKEKFIKEMNDLLEELRADVSEKIALKNKQSEKIRGLFKVASEAVEPVSRDVVGKPKVEEKKVTIKPNLNLSIVADKVAFLQDNIPNIQTRNGLKQGQVEALFNGHWRKIRVIQKVDVIRRQGVKVTNPEIGEIFIIAKGNEIENLILNTEDRKGFYWISYHSDLYRDSQEVYKKVLRNFN